MAQKSILTIITLTFLTLPVIGGAVIGCANTSKGDKQHGDRQPPKEAIEACVDKAEGDPVSFKGRRGESLEALCKMMDDQLVAVPEGMESKGNRPPRK